MMNLNSKGYFFVFFIICINLFVFNIKAEAGQTATIVDLKDSKVVLTKLITSAITVKTGESDQVIPLKSIKEMIMKGNEGTFFIKLVSGKETIGQSDSTIQGTWELGEYKISLSKVKSIVIGGLSQVSKWKRPKGYVAEVTDIKGSITDVYGLGFGYTYHYTRSNCMWNCGASSSTILESLPLNQGKGALLIPLNKIGSITDISTSGKYSHEYNSSIVLTNGEIIKSRFGFFADEKIESIKGKTELGEYTLSLKKAKKIVFKHKKNISPLPKYEWGKTSGELKTSVTCQSGNTISLVNVWKYAPSSNGKASKYGSSSTVKIKIGEAQNDIDLNKISEININPEKTGKHSTKYPIVLTTKSGNKVNAILEDNNYIGGYIKKGWFFYVKLKDLKQISFK
ncbi:MAG: hypothetical protein K8R74_13650 [Bacteroidales bacterium]|nr:hypothetical protein [Bacteroidales bacterium]